MNLKNYILNYRRIITSPIFYLSLIIFFIFLHEIAHGITAIIFGGEFKGIWLTAYVGYGKKADVSDNFRIYTYTYYNDSLLCYRAVKVAGSLTAASTATVLNYISRKKRNLVVFQSTLVVIIYELVYWAISPMIKFGDGYQFLQSFEGMTYSIMTLISLIFFVIFISVSILLTKSFITMLILNETEKSNQILK